MSYSKKKREHIHSNVENFKICTMGRSLPAAIHHKRSDDEQDLGLYMGMHIALHERVQVYATSASPMHKGTANEFMFVGATVPLGGSV